MGSTRTSLRVACLGILLSFLGCSSADVPESPWKNPEKVSNYTPGVRSLVFSPTGEHLASLHVAMVPWDVRADPLFLTPKVILWTVSEPDFCPRSLMSQEVGSSGFLWGEPRFDELGNHLLAGTEKGLWRYDLTDNTSSLTSYDSDPGVPGDVDFFVKRAEDDTLTIRRTDTGQVVSALDCAASGRSPQFCGSDAKYLLCGGHKQMQLFEVSNGKSVLEFSVGDLRYPVCVSKSLTNDSLMTDRPLFMAAYDESMNAVGVWSLETGQLLQEFASGWEEVWSVAMSPDNAFLAVSGESLTEDGEGTGLVRFWNLATGEELEPIEDDSTWGITAVAFSPDGKRLATGDGDGTIKLWPLPEEMRSSVENE